MDAGGVITITLYVSMASLIKNIHELKNDLH